MDKIVEQVGRRNNCASFYILLAPVRVRVTLVGLLQAPFAASSGAKLSIAAQHSWALTTSSRATTRMT